jgi:hypothetical protein
MSVRGFLPLELCLPCVNLNMISLSIFNTLILSQYFRVSGVTLFLFDICRVFWHGISEGLDVIEPVSSSTRSPKGDYL